jgi:hypothetical protein
MHPPGLTLTFTLLATSVGAGTIASVLLGIELLAAGSTFAKATRRLLARALTPKTLLAAVLIASLLGSRFLATHLIQTLRAQDNQYVLDLEDLPVLQCEARTDKGRAVALFHFAIHTAADEVERFMRASETVQTQVIRLEGANPAANCHGWVFTGGAYGVRDSDVRLILEDHQYETTNEPREGDLALYFQDGQLTHAGLARRPDPRGPILVESKWGPFGLYLHPPEKQPFSGLCQFFRSPRPGHLLTITTPAVISSAE